MPLLKVYELVLEQFKARLRDDEVMVRFMRIPVPDYDEPAFREAFVNALVHTETTRASGQFTSDGSRTVSW
jgi:predicted HTH transcriptional regulator